ncbi:MAG: hypothetical protein QOH97_3604 [Actinoplanes sp.]|jgi:hypothetical protein|nr:hypothetical protein [Actinoplanes sp.]
MTDVTGDLAIPDPDERAALNAALLATGTETGFWDDQGRPTPWPDDIDEWTPATKGPVTHKPGEHPF